MNIRKLEDLSKDELIELIKQEREACGPAFPLPVDDEKCRARFESGYGGMALRDYFAAQVIGPAFLDLFTGWRQRGEPVQEDWPMGLAIDAYRVADAMLEARENKS